jgi:hypothetical protein
VSCNPNPENPTPKKDPTPPRLTAKCSRTGPKTAMKASRTSRRRRVRQSSSPRPLRPEPRVYRRRYAVDAQGCVTVDLPPRRPS